MDRNANYILVGVFVTIMMLVGAVFTIWIADSYDKKIVSHYTIYFTGDVNGLGVGGIVRYKGVQVGKVIGIRLAKKRTDLVKADIEIDENTPVRSRTKAVLKPLGITGLSFIELETDNIDTEPPHKIEDEPYLVIYSAESELERVFKDIPQVSQSLLETIGRLNAVLTTENIENISEVILYTKKATQNFSLLLDDQKIETISQTLDNVHSASEEFKEALESFSTATNNIEMASDTLEKIFKGNELPLDRFTSDGLDQIMLLIKDSRNMVNAVRKLSERLEEDPSILIYQPSYEGVKVKKK